MSHGPPLVARAEVRTSLRHPSVGHPPKRLMDVLGAALLLTLTAPLLAVASALVALTSRGPVFYRRRVVGLGGAGFDALKLRTMVADADRRLAEDADLRTAFEVNFKLIQDPRVTPVGRILRKWSIDELPQLVNVLRGEMSLVGPRMITAGELDKYGPAAARLLSVRPGLSGVWQISGRQDVDYTERVRLDLDYIEHWTFGRDVAIAVRTPATVFRARGAR